jgi:hypothetical protein
MAKGKAKVKAKGASARPARASKPRKREKTLVVHVDKQTYAAIRKARRKDDRGLGAPLRRLIGLDPISAEPGE